MTPPAVTPPRQAPRDAVTSGARHAFTGASPRPCGPGHGVDGASRTSPLLTEAAVTDVHAAHPGSPPVSRQRDTDGTSTGRRPQPHSGKNRRARPTTAAPPAGGCWASTRATAGSPTRSTSPPATPGPGCAPRCTPAPTRWTWSPRHAHRRRRGPRLGHDQPGRHPYRPGGPAGRRRMVRQPGRRGSADDGGHGHGGHDGAPSSPTTPPPVRSRRCAPAPRCCA